MSFRSTEGPFMEPTKHATYYEDACTQARNEDDSPEALGFDLCEDSSEEESNDTKIRHARKTAQHTTSHGSIKKPTYKPRNEATRRQPAYKIAPNRNPRHSISLPSDASDSESLILAHEPPKQSSPAKAFAQEKAWQHQLSGTARFDNVRRQRMEDRQRRYDASLRARKTRERALRDAEIAAACLVDDDAVPACSFYVQVDRSETPGEFVDFTCRKEKRVASKMWPPRNWKGEDMKLGPGDAYVLVIV